MKYVKSIFSAFFLVLVCSAAFGEYFTISDYTIAIDVTRENRYVISETIDVEFSEPRHGIYRDIPNRFYQKPILIDNVNVAGHTFVLENQAGSLRIRIGDADRFVEGRQRYVITYDYQISRDPYPDIDEFYFNLIGTAWETSIERVNFSIRMPGAFDPEPLSFTYGRQGSTAKAPVQVNINGNNISGVLDETLAPYEGFTIALPLVEGYFDAAEDLEEPIRALYRKLELPFDIICILFAFGMWYAFGRDKKLTTVIEYQAPDNLTPAEIGYIIDGTVDSKDITSLIVYLAQKGYLEIEVENSGLLGSTMTLTRIKTMASDADEPEFVHSLFHSLFDTYGENDVVTTKDLRNKFHVTMAKLKRMVTSSFTSESSRRIYERPKWFVQLLLFGFAVFAVVKTAYPILLDLLLVSESAIIATIFGSLLVILGTSMAARAFGNQQGFEPFAGIVKIIGGLLVSAGPGLVIFLIAKDSVDINPVYLIATLITVFLASLFLHLMQKRTEIGDKLVERVLGLREFIERAENDRIEELFEDNPSYFYDILPYAIVLGLSEKWAKHFDTIALEPPGWYHSPYRTAFRATAFQHSLDRSFNSLNQSMTTSPSSSSSSSSGGSSGGGSGGGGGGSW